MQNLCEHTIERIIDDPDVSSKVVELYDMVDGDLELVMFSKFGVDGTKGIPIFKMICDEERKQGACIVSNLVPMQLVAFMGDHMHIIYQNPHVCSAYGCRPLRHWYTEEKENTAKEEIARLQGEASSLVAIDFGGGVIVNFKNFFSMNDLKIENFKFENRSPLKCAYCGAVPTQFHKKRDFMANLEYLGDLCMACLHFLIRTTEHLLKAGFRQDSKKWFKRLSDEEHRMEDIRREEIKSTFKDRGLPIFEPRDSGNIQTQKIYTN